jgi:hypothetical protein
MVFFSQQIFADMFWSDVPPCGEQQLCLQKPIPSQGYFPCYAFLLSHDDGLEFFPVCHCMKA